MTVMWWNSWWNLRTKKLHESAHLEEIKGYQWMLCDDTLDEIREEKQYVNLIIDEAMNEYEWMLCDETLDEI